MNRLFLKKNYKYRLEIKIMSKLVRLRHVGIHINNAAVSNCDIVIFFNLMSQLLTTTLNFKKLQCRSY